ncbi:hypothetical protein MICAC_790004 [Microcystis aeruginosa PCC 9443]|uniref:Uncharacterized protein n=1 Tax=Microcystis aeruginosa PCC 9443 TaxID=1160281 RepID=I4GBF7_MICAE|nr:hypothetical protein MICAC_790004 [Microcystis aeruginosa PCC 9443]
MPLYHAHTEPRRAEYLALQQQGFPLIKLAKKLKAVGAIHELPLLGWFPLIKLAKKLKDHPLWMRMRSYFMVSFH